MIHLTPQQLSSYMDGELNDVSTELVRRHMGACEECTLKFAALDEQEEQLSNALVHEPGDDFFDRFAADVERQLPAGKESGLKRGPSSPASRAAALREAGRAAAQSTSTPFPAVEAETDRPTAVKRPAPEVKSVPASLPLGDDADFDADETLASLSVDRPSDERAPAPKPPPVRPPVQDVAPRPAARPAARPVEKRAPSPPPASRTRVAPRPQRHPRIRRPTPSIPWYAALILALIAGAAGVVVSRTDPVSTWLDSHGLRSLTPSTEKPGAVDQGLPSVSPEQGAPTGSDQETPPGDQTHSNDAAPPADDSEASAQDDFEPEPQSATWFLRPSPARASDPFASLPATSLAKVRAAQRGKAAADASPSAPRYEAAAAQWEQTIPLLRGARQQSLGRLELASSRYRAWENEPTEERATAAATALRTYLTLAPQGAPRELARNWLARVSR